MLASSTKLTLENNLFPWYDGYWLYSYVKCRDFIQKKFPEKLIEFENAFEILKTPPDFQTKQLTQIISDETHQEILEIVQNLKKEDFEKHEFFEFGRLILHDSPYFTELQKTLCPLVSKLTGEEVELSYNFLSLYNSLGNLNPHMDAAPAKWTLDYCIDQSQIWPIYLSKVQDWPIDFKNEDNWIEKIKQNESNEFVEHLLEPGKAVLFSGTSQWHYRERITTKNEKQFCSLIFFHFIPKGSKDLCYPRKWAEIFDMKELGDLVIDF
jgi:hypothetical protein